MADENSAEILDAIAGLREEIACLRTELASVCAAVHGVDDKLRSHLVDALGVAQVMANQQRRQQMIGRATIAVSRAVLDQPDADGDGHALAAIISRLEAEISPG